MSHLKQALHGRIAPIVLAALGLGLASVVLAAQPVRIHATLGESRDPAMITLEVPDGSVVSGHKAPDLRVTGVKRASLSDIHQGSFIGTAALPGPDGTLRALEVNIFPESMRGVGEGHRTMDAGQDKTMTNGAVGTVASTGRLALTVTYKGGEQRVTVDPNTPVVALEPGDDSMLTVGAHVIASGHREDDRVVFDRVLVGLDGLDPPM